MAVNVPFGDPNAHGTFCDTITWSRYRGKTSLKHKPRPKLNYVPTDKQKNPRKAMSLLATSWKAEPSAYKETWNTYGGTINQSGYIAYTSRGTDAYITQLGSDTTPASVSVSGNPPAETWIWS